MAGLIFMSFYSISNTILTIAFVAPYRNFTKKHTIDYVKKMFFQSETITLVAPAEKSTAITAVVMSPRRY